MSDEIIDHGPVHVNSTPSVSETPSKWVQIADDVLQVLLLAINTAAKAGAFHADHFSVIGNAVDHAKNQIVKARESK